MKRDRSKHTERDNKQDLEGLSSRVEATEVGNKTVNGSMKVRAIMFKH